MSFLERLCVIVFGRLVRLWHRDLRAAYGRSAVTTFEQRLVAARRCGSARFAWVAARELSSALGLIARGRLPGRSASRRSRSSSLRLGRGGAAHRGWGHDFRLALRTIRRHPGFSLAVLVMLCLGIGLNVATVSLLDAILVRPLPFPDSGRLVALWGTRDGELTRFGNMSWLDLVDYRESVDAFGALGGVNGPRAAAVLFGEHPDLVPVTRVTPGAFEALGVAPSLGRLLGPEDQETGDVALLAWDAWQRRFGADPAVLGRTLLIDGEPHRIVGVVPDSPDVVAGATEIWLPVMPAGHSRGSRNLTVIGRLAPGVSLPSAQARVDGLAASLADRFPDSNEGAGVHLRPLHAQVVGEEIPRLLLLLQGGALAVLLIVCANVANLYLARAEERRREVAVMSALGASTGRVARPMLFEGLLLAGCGALFGLVVAARLPALLGHFGAPQLPRLDELAVDVRLVAIAVALALAVACLAAIIPAWTVGRRDLRSALAATVPGSSRAGGRGRDLLVVLQIAGAVVLVFVAGLFLKSLRTLADVDPGFDPADRLVVSLSLSSIGFAGPTEAMAFQQQAIERLEALPGAARVGGVSMLPLDGGNLCDDASVAGLEVEIGCAEYRSVTPGYFAAMGIDIVDGRAPTAADGSEAAPVALVNRTFARHFFAEGTAIGARVRGRDASREIVGVVEDVRHFGLDSAPRPEVYLPFSQAPFPLLTLVVRSDSGLDLSATAIREALWSVDPRLAAPDIRALESLVITSIAAPRLRGALFSTFGVIAVVLAMGGIAGVLAGNVRQRRREIGIRMALGSRASGVRRLILGDALRLTAFGLVVGSGVAALLARTLRSLLFQVDALDPAVVAGTLLLLLGTALLAAWAPAQTASRVDPVRTLRQE